VKMSEFISTYRSKGLPAWEAAAVEMCRTGSMIAWPLLPVTFTDGARTCVVKAACDYLAVGEPDDYLRLPLTPGTAQRIADLFGMLLPTKKIATELWRQAPLKATPQPQVPNKGADLDQYVASDRATEAKERWPGVPEVGEICDFILADSKRAICMARARAGTTCRPWATIRVAPSPAR